MLHPSFWAVPAFMRVLPMSTSGPTTGQMATSTSSVNSSRGVQVTYTVRAPRERGRAPGGPPPPVRPRPPRARRPTPARREPPARVLRSDLEVVHRLSPLIGAILGAFDGADDRGVAAGDDAPDLVGRGGERGGA